MSSIWLLVRTFIEEKAPAGSNFWSLFEMFSVHKILIFVLTFSQSLLLILDVRPRECVAIYILREQDLTRLAVDKDKPMNSELLIESKS